MRRTGALVVCVCAAALWATALRASADPASDAARREAEDAFVGGALDALDSILRGGATAADAEPLFVRDVVWRPTHALPVLPHDDGSLSARRVRWLVDEYATGKSPLDRYPLPATGEADVYPRLTALVLDRARRESLGTAGLPDASPLANVKDDEIRWLHEWFSRVAFPRSSSLPAALPTTPEERAFADREREYRDRFAFVAARNRLVAIAAVLGLVLAVLAVGVWIGRGPKRRAGRTDS